MKEEYGKRLQVYLQKYQLIMTKIRKLLNFFANVQNKFHYAITSQTAAEIKKLERNVSGYFDYIEDLIERRNTFTMEEFSNSIDRFLDFREYKILEGHGKISMKRAREKAAEEYEEFNNTKNII